MSLTGTPSAERTHIAFFGRRNAGKSSLVNAVTGQDLAVVSDVAGTTTDPVRKSMELLPLGPVVIIDTPGLDDDGALGALRVRKTRQIMNSADLAVVVLDAAEGMGETEEQLCRTLAEKEIPFLIVCNKCDLSMPEEALRRGWLCVSALTGEGIHELKEEIARLAAAEKEEKTLIGDLVRDRDTVVLVCPIDGSAPKGRLILPQTLAIRDLLDHGAMPLVCRDTELVSALGALAGKPAMVVTDSQAFSHVNAVVPEDVPLTSFSILMARYKGFLAAAAKGVRAIRNLKDGDTVLMAEGCTHHRQCADIGTVRIPNWLRHYTDADIRIETSSGTDFPEDLRPYAAVIHCGGCMLNEREVRSRMRAAQDQGVPFTNYGLVIAEMKGILARSTALFPDLKESLSE